MPPFLYNLINQIEEVNMETIHFEIKNLKELFFIEKSYRKDEIKTYAVIQKENVPEAPILWYYMLKERKKSNHTKHKFATLSELILFFYSMQDQTGMRLYKHFFDLFLKKYDLAQVEKIKPLQKNEADFVKLVGQNIYALEANQNQYRL